MRLARRQLGRSDLRHGAQDWRDDCSGLVTGCFAVAGVEVLSPSARGTSGTALLYATMEERGAVFADGVPRAGDLVFFDDTWDADGDGRRGDRLTHVGLVERVRADGVVEFLHYLGGAVKRGRLDPTRPGVHRDPATGEVVNDWLRRRTRADVDRLLAGELFAGYGRP